MPNNRNTDNQSEQPLDNIDWEIAFVAYEGNPGAALMLAFNLVILESYLSIEPIKIQEAIAGIHRGVEVLFPYTQFHDVAHDMFLRLVEGRLTSEEEDILKSLGIKF
jgi:hypothetical protein